MKKNIKRIFSMLLVFAVAMSAVGPVKVTASASTNKLTVTFRDGENEQGKVQYSLDDGATWIDVTSNINNQDINVTGNNLRIRIVPNENFVIDPAGIEYSEDDQHYHLNTNNSVAGGLMGSNGYLSDASATHVYLNNVEFSQGGGGEPHFDGKAYILWSCKSGGICMKHYTDIPDFNNGDSTFYKDTDVVDQRTGEHFNTKAKYKGWSTDGKFDSWVAAYKAYKGITGDIDWSTVDPADMLGDPIDMREYEEASGCSKEEPIDVFENCVNEYVAANVQGVFAVRAQLQPVGEPTDNNAYVSYGDRNFKVVIYNSDYKGVTIGSLNDLNYYPGEWTNPFLRQDQFDISGTTKDKPTYINAVLFEKTLNIKTKNYNGFAINKIEALDVPNDAVEVKKVDGEWKITFSSHFYDNVTFKVTDSNGKVSYFAVKRYTVDAWVTWIDNKPVYNADFYFEDTKSYKDFVLTAKIIFKDGTTKDVKLEAGKGIDDGLGNIANDKYEVTTGKGLKKASFRYALTEKESRNIKNAYTNVELKGSTSTKFAGTYAGSGKGILANIYTGEEN